MTEEEAKTKACCGVEGCGEYSRQHLRLDGIAIRVCIGSQCIAWRWASSHTVVGDFQGFCGLVGKP